MGKKDRSKNKRKTFMSYYWPFLAIVFGPVVLYLIFALIYTLATRSNILFLWEFYATIFGIVLLYLVIHLSYFGFVIAALIFSIPLLILLYGAIFSAKKVKKAKSIENGETKKAESETDETEKGET